MKCGVLSSPQMANFYFNYIFAYRYNVMFKFYLCLQEEVRSRHSFLTFAFQCIQHFTPFSALSVVDSLSILLCIEQGTHCLSTQNIIDQATFIVCVCVCEKWL